MDWSRWFEYKEGELYWKTVSSHSTPKVGELAGDYCKGYRRVRLLKKSYSVHRIIWELHNGEIPFGFQIDHINRVKDDNRIENLRLATHQENNRNKDYQSNNKLKLKGIHWVSRIQKYKASIKIGKVSKHLGYFRTIEEASQVYQEASKELHGEFACTTS